MSILLITALGGFGVASASPNDTPPDAKSPPATHGDVQVTVGKPRLGIVALPISPELRSHFGAPGDRGILVDRVQPDSPAARAGLQVGDIVTDVDGKPTQSAADVLEALSDRRKGDQVAVTVFRDHQRVDLRVRLDTDPGRAGRPNQRRGFDRFENLPDDLDHWLPPGGDQDQLRRQIEELRRRMQRLERQLQRHPIAPGEPERT